jgi:hypothetical protein
LGSGFARWAEPPTISVNPIPVGLSQHEFKEVLLRLAFHPTTVVSPEQEEVGYVDDADCPAGGGGILQLYRERLGVELKY